MIYQQGFPYSEIHFNKEGGLDNPQELAALLEMIRDAHLTDLIVMVHGWNNSVKAAGGLYDEILLAAGAARENDPTLKAALGTRQLGFVGFYWPSMRYVGGSYTIADTDIGVPATVGAQLDDALQVFPDGQMHQALQNLKANQADIVYKGSLRQELVTAVQAQIPSINDPDAPLHGEDFADHHDVEARLGDIDPNPAAEARSGAASGIADTVIWAVQSLLNLTTFYEMKNRAGTIAQLGGVNVVRDVRAQYPDLKVHLVGHSFGGRFISALARGQDGEAALPINSLSLLQAAFSHNGFGQQEGDAPEGYFHDVVTQRRVTGPILVTHTKNDLAVGLAYPAAALLARQNASAVGDADDPYGAIGSNGALHVGAQELELTPTTGLSFQGGQVYNLHADFIKDHGNVGQEGVLRAVLYAVAAT